MAEKELMAEKAKNVPQEEVDRLTEEKLPLPQNDQQLLYRWAKDTKQEQLKAEILADRDKQFPEVAKAGVEELSEMHKQARKVLDICDDVVPTDEEKKPLRFDYEKEVSLDLNLDLQQRKMLKEEYKKQQDELAAEQERKLHPKLQRKEDEELKAKIEKEAALRLGMSEKEKREERLRILKEEKEARSKKRTFRKDFMNRLRKAEENKNAKIENEKNKKIEGKLEDAGSAIEGLRGKLGKNVFAEGELGDAYKQLDLAFVSGDLDKGKELREKLGVEPEPKAAAKAEPNAQPKKNPENDLEVSLDDSFHEDLNYTVVEDDVLFRQEEPPVQEEVNQNQNQNPAPDELIYQAQAQFLKELKGVKPENNKPYIFQKEYVDPEEEKEGPQNDVFGEEEEYSNLDIDGTVAEKQNDQLLKNIPQLFASVKNDPGMSKDDRDWRLSTILAVHGLVKQANKAQDVEQITNDDIEQTAAKIKASAAYKLLFAKGAPNYLGEESADKLIADYSKNVKKINAYGVPEAEQPALKDKLGSVVKALEDTHSGKIIRYIPRGPLFGNSRGYNSALAAIKAVKDHKGTLSADEIYQSTEAVLKYLEGKETVRKRAFGRERWNQCMSFLSQTMPADKFKAYCDQVNAARGISNNPAHKDFVSPEKFAAAPAKQGPEAQPAQPEKNNELQAGGPQKGGVS